MSKLFVDLTIAFRSLVQHRRRTLFLGTAIAAVTALLVLLNGLSTGVRETMIDTATTLSTGHVNVGGFFKVTAGQAAPVVTDYKKVLEVAQEGGPRDGLRGPARPRLGQGRLRHRVDAARASPASTSSSEPEVRAGAAAGERQARRSRRSRARS